MKIFKSNLNGITLIALVITIIVLLILAGITINLTIGDQGIISRAQQASRNYKSAEQAEQEQLSGIDNYLDNLKDQNEENDDENYDSATGGEFKLMDHELNIVYKQVYYNEYFTDTTHSIKDNNCQIIECVDGSGNIDNRFTSPNSILKKYKNPEGTEDKTIIGWVPDKYYTDPPNGTYANSPYALEFSTDADEMIFWAYGYIRISVDNLDGNGYKMSSLDGFAIGVESAPYGYVYVDFGEGNTSMKNIKIETEGTLGHFIIANDKKIETVQKNSQNNQKKILFIGDSWTEGAGIDDGKRYLSYSNIIADRFNMICINDGVGGSGYTDLTIYGSGKLNQSYAQRLQNQLDTFSPDVIVINGGGNDVLNNKEVSEITQDVDSLYKQLTAYKNSKPGCKVVIFGVNFIDGCFYDYDAKIIELNKELIKKAKEYNFPYIDYITGDTYGANGNKITQGNGAYLSKILNASYIASDDQHPSEAGNKYLGEVLAKEFEKALMSIK